MGAPRISSDAQEHHWRACRKAWRQAQGLLVSILPRPAPVRRRLGDAPRGTSRPAEAIGQPSGASDATTPIRSRTTIARTNVAIRYGPPDRRRLCENLTMLPSQFNGTAAVAAPERSPSRPHDFTCGSRRMWHFPQLVKYFRVFLMQIFRSQLVVLNSTRAIHRSLEWCARPA